MPSEERCTVIYLAGNSSDIKKDLVDNREIYLLKTLMEKSIIGWIKFQKEKTFSSCLQGWNMASLTFTLAARQT